MPQNVDEIVTSLKPVFLILGVEPEKVKLLSGLKPDALVENKGNDEFAITFVVGPKNRFTILNTIYIYV